MRGLDTSSAPSGSGSTAPSSNTLPLPAKPTFPRQRSRGQLARRNSITRGREDLRDRRQRGKRRAMDSMQAKSPSSIRSGIKSEKPWLGGLYFTDIVFIAFTYSINLLRTCGLAELADLIFKGLVYALTRLPYDLFCRWSLSRPPMSSHSNETTQKPRRRHRRKATKLTKGGSSSESETQDGHQPPQAFSSSTEPEPEFPMDHSPAQLSPFHHIVILLVRFACSNFPHLVPRILFAEETIGPFVYWRTGGGSNAMVQEFTDLQERSVPAIQDGKRAPTTANKEMGEAQFRAYLLSKDARLPIEVQRSNMASRKATMLFYLHGGGFSLGSVAFYAEALLRLRAKICALEAVDGNEDNVAEARCVAVEYDLSPAARFPLPLLQCLRCYAHMIEVERVDPDSICIAGDSAGGNLAMGLLLCLDGQMKGEASLSERDWSQLPMPGKAVLISPWVDLRPLHARAFSMLRSVDDEDQQAKKQNEKKAQAAKGESEKGQKEWAEAVADYDWDYVASEALLHFAQVYTGVLPSPRRVGGPLGWIANLCGVVAQEYIDDSSKESTSGKYIDPMGALSALIRPSKRLAQATHDMLSDPFFSRILGLKDTNTLSSQEDMSKALATSVPNTTSSFEPLFTASDRKTRVVANQGELFEPITNGKIQSPSSTAQKIGMDKSTSDQARFKAEILLDTHPLISPAIGNWSKINLKHGCLVTWGERERMAEDIEAWVDSVCRNVENEKDAPPAQDGANEGKQQQQQSRDHVEDERDEYYDSWIEAAVERGPGGVHAWPFVSMYLAGTEAERERGLDLLAEFIARSSPEAAKAAAAAGYEDKWGVVSTDLPHAAPDSPVSESGSAGSMPSDVDLHGLVGEEDEGERFQGIAPAIDLEEAVRKAQELSNKSQWQESSLGLGLSNDRDTPQVSRFEEPSEDVDLKTSSQDLKSASTSTLTTGRQDQRVGLPRIVTERQRGRSRSPRRSNTFTTTSHINSPTVAPNLVGSVQLHRPIITQAKTGLSEGETLEYAASQTADKLWWTTPHIRDEDQVEEGAADQSERVEEVEEEEEARNEALDTTTSRRSIQSLEDILEVSSEEALSPNRSISPPSQNEPTGNDNEDVGDYGQEEGGEEEDEEREAMRALASTPLDISHYGLSHYAIRRPEPEGLSDIAEEGSVLSASITSAGELNSRSLSPAEPWRNQSPQTSLTAASMVMREQDWNNRWDRPRWPVEEEDDDEETSMENQMSISPPSQPPQPGPSLPLIQPINHQQLQKSALKSSENVNLTNEQFDSSEAQGVARKKPKGDVWW